MAGAREPGSGREAGSDSETRRYVMGGLEVLGVDAADDEIAVIEAVDAHYRPLINSLLAEGLDGVPHEPGAEMSQPPRTDAGR